MAYESEVRPTPPPATRVADTATSYALPIVALLAILGLGFWYYSYSNTASTPMNTTIERTTPAPTTPANPAPIVRTPAPTTPK